MTLVHLDFWENAVYPSYTPTKKSTDMDHEAVTTLILKEWVPPLISVLSGGLIISLLVPRWQATFERSRLYDKRRLEILESISQDFSRYIDNWRRLIQISHHEVRKGNLDDDEKARKQRFIEDRNLARDTLISDLSTARIYFSESVDTLIAEFSDWDQACTVKRLSDLPEIGMWRSWEARIISAMKQELKGL